MEEADPLAQDERWRHAQDTQVERGQGEALLRDRPSGQRVSNALGNLPVCRG